MEEKSTSVRREILVHVPIEKAWRALTIPGERNKWETKSCEIDLRVGGTAFFDYGWGVSYTAKIVELVEYEKMVLEGEDKHLTIWTLEQSGHMTKVTVEYTGIWIGDLGHMQMDNMAFGTYQFMRNFKTVMEEGRDIRGLFWKSWIGVLHRTYKGEEVQGVKVMQIVPDTPAEGFLQEGDIITSVNGNAITSYDDLEIIVTEATPEEVLVFEISRNAEKRMLKVQTIAYGQKLVK
ncbi:PDZ domain-containing protein [Bacillus oleivorans]|uniref:PDZ domain-containing protein n=1 Tax=Bacillus oleivorans TaxID=1448271 RepID=A0A285CLW0_9BACI|nr:SRPBCC domain-containing protein [Bacillus oleivorans]SNX68517.1 PDZ domain-containing protein [Bacillus oleivorans]